ncbi:MAG: hypothetical protein ACK56I_24770, partial [bacterium]
MRLQVRANRTRSADTCHDLLQDDRLRAATRGLVDADGNRALIQYNSLSEVAESKNQLAPPDARGASSKASLRPGVSSFAFGLLEPSLLFCRHPRPGGMDRSVGG